MSGSVSTGTGADQHASSLFPLSLANLAPLFWRPPRIGITSAWWSHVPFGQWLVAATRPNTIVELGTHGGVSYSAFCEAVIRCGLDTRCSAVDTWKGDAHAGFYDSSVLAELRTFHDARYGAFSNLIQSSFDEALDYFGDGTIDLLHIDGLHSYEAVAHDFTTWLRKLSSRSVVLLHDINVRQDGFGVWRFWEEQCRCHPHFAFAHGHGLGVMIVGQDAPADVQALCSITDPNTISTLRERFALVGERWDLEYRDRVRTAQLAPLTEAIETLTVERDKGARLASMLEEEVSTLRPHAADLEQARATLHDALQEQIARAEALAEQIVALRRENDALDARSANARCPSRPAATHEFATRGSRERGIGQVRKVPEAQGSGQLQPLHSSTQVRARWRRACVFSFYDDRGIVDDYVVFFLRELGKFVQRILFYSNGPLTRDSEIMLRDCVDQVILRPNVGFDVMAYKEGLERIAFDAEAYDEVIMANHTCYGPVFPFAELFGDMESRDCDFWGVTAHMAMTPNPMTGTGTLPYHLNANFIAVRRDLLLSQTFRRYWDEIKPSEHYEEAILSHEAIFTEHFTDLGYKADTYIDSRKYGSHYPAILDIDETLLDRNPLIKRRAFFHDPRFLERYAADLPRALRVLAKTADYDRSLIWRNIVRSAELRTLNTNAALTSVLPDVRIKQDAPLPDCGRLAVCVHVYYTDMLEEILALTDTIPLPFDFIATTDTAEKKAEIEKVARGRGKIENLIVRVVEQNRGRDMAALFITCRDLFLDDTYDLVCRLHTKKTPQVAGGQANLFKRHMFENLMNSPGFTANVLDVFHDNPWIGVAVPPVVQISYWTLGHAWYCNRDMAEEVGNRLRLNVRFDPDTPVAAYGTMFWFRPKALRKLFAYPWKWSEFNAEPNHVDGGLAHVLERLICYVAQDARYTTQQILQADLAGWNYGILEYKLQKLSAALPNSDFSFQCNMLERWKGAGYPMHRPEPQSAPQPEQLPEPVPEQPLLAEPVPEPPLLAEPVAEQLFLSAPPPSSVRRSLAELLMASKRSLAYRAPKTVKIARPVYRAVIGKGPVPTSREGI